jgi:polysaccharide deacetylase 2 family uncharacterized protein YibQ
MLALAAVVYVGGRFIFSPRGRYVVATTVLGGGPGQMRPILEAALGRAARDLNLPPPYPELVCEPDSGGTHLCSTVIGLTPGVSVLQGNAKFTSELLSMGVDLVSGVQNLDGTVNLRYRAGSKVVLSAELVPAASTGLDTVVTPAPGMRQVEVRGRLALIVEDYGVRGPQSRRIQNLPGTFTAAIRPNQDNAEAWVKEARQSGLEVILNLPMEPRDYPTRNPGEDAILVDLSGREIRKRVKRALDKVGPVAGVKTYMGSLAVEDRDVMRPVLEELHARNLFLIEASRSQYSTVSELARALELPFYTVTSISEVDAGRRDEGTIGIRFDDLIRRCRAKGYAIGIIHARDVTLAVLEERLSRLAREGIVVMGISEIMRAHALE